MGAKHAKWFVTSAKTTGWLRETELVPKTQGIVDVDQGDRSSRWASRKHGKVPPPFPPHVAERRGRGARALRPRQGAGSRRRRRDRPGREGARAHRARPRRRRRSQRGPYGQDRSRSRSCRERSRRVRTVAYYKGCLASLSAKELDISTQALAPKVGLELIELESVTCCGAGDIHEAEPDYYLHLNARILAYAEADGRGHADDDLQRLHAQPAAGELRSCRTTTTLRARVNENLETVGVAAVRGRRRGQALPLADRRGRGLRAAEAGRAQGAEGPQDRAVLRLPDPAPVEDPRLRGSGPAVVARADHRGLRRRGDRLPGEDQVLRLPDHPGARGDGARRADPADRAGEGGRRRRDGHAVPALPPLARRVAVEAEEGDRQGLPDADPAPLAADRRRGRARGRRS